MYLEILELDAANVGRARTLFGFLGFKRYLVAFAKLVEGNVNEAGGVKKHILSAAVWGDESKSFFGLDPLDNTSHRYDKFTN